MKTMKKVWWLALLLILPIVSASTISEWPYFFVKNGKFTAKYVIADEAPALDVVSATVISTSLARFQNVTTEVGTSVLDTEISDITAIDAVVIGSPCENKAAAKLMGNPEPCYKDLGGSVGYIKLYQNGKTQLLITGLDEKDRNAAAKYFAQKDMSTIQMTEYVVPSNSGSVPSFFEQRFKVKNAANVSENITASTNITNITAPALSKNITPKKSAPGPYEPLSGIPKKKLGFWASLWAWIKGLFT